MVKNLPAKAGDMGDVGSILGLGRSPGGRNDNSLQYSCLGNSMDRGARWATVHGVAESTEQLTLWLSGLCQVLEKCSDFWSWASVVTADGLFFFSHANHS